MAQPAPRPSSPLNRLLKALNSIVSTQDRLSGLDLSSLVEVKNIADTDALMIGTGDGAKKLSTNVNLPYTIMDIGSRSTAVGGKGCIFRGIGIGTAVTDKQWEAIRSGTFENMFLGDYWMIGGMQWIIVDFDYWYRIGNTEVSDDIHHVVVMPVSGIINKPMNSTDTTDGGYIGSEMRKTHLNDAKAIVYSAFGSDHIYVHQELMSNRVTGESVTGVMWTDASVEIPSESMITGIRSMSSRISVSDVYEESNWRQLSWFQAQHRWRPKVSIWMRDVVNSSCFGLMGYPGNSGRRNASLSTAVIPIFAIKG